MIPDVIIVLSAGSVSEKNSDTGQTIYRSTTYDEGDAFGTLGGYARVEAAALLAKKYPQAFLITTGKDGPGGVMSCAEIEARELENLGVSRERIALEELSVNTLTQIGESLKIVQTRGWKKVLFVTNQYQVERVRTFMEFFYRHSAQEIEYQDAESVLAENNPEFSAQIFRIEQSAAYQKRLASEARGVNAIKSGKYHSAPLEDKRERSV